METTNKACDVGFVCTVCVGAGDMWVVERGRAKEEKKKREQITRLK